MVRVGRSPALRQGATTQPAAAAAAANGADAAAEEADGAAEPAAKKPRHDTAATAAGGSGPRGMASVTSSAGAQQPVACYVCQLATIPGKFDPQKAAQLGVARGPVSTSLSLLLLLLLIWALASTACAVGCAEAFA